MSINLSSFAGAGGQLFTDNGIPLVGGKIYTYLAGTTTPAATYTSRTGAAYNTNPIILDAGGRTPYEIWLDGGAAYKFVVKSALDVLIGTYDDLPSVNDPTITNALLVVSGTNTLTAISTPPLTGYTAGRTYSFVTQNTNTGSVTINIDGLGAKAITKFGATALAGGDLRVGQISIIEYDGTRFQLLNAASNNFAQVILFGL